MTIRWPGPNCRAICTAAHKLTHELDPTNNPTPALDLQKGDGTIVLDKPSTHAHRHRICYFDRFLNPILSNLKIPRQTIHSNPFNQRVNLVSSPCSLFFRRRIHHSIFDTIVQPASKWIRKHNQQLRQPREQIIQHSCNRPSGTFS